MKVLEKKLIKIIEDVMNLTLDRSFIENRLDGWVDMKIDPSTLNDVYDKSIWYSENKIYSWIQGRALETISEYIKNIDLVDIDKNLLIKGGDLLYFKLFSLVDNNEYILHKANIPFVFEKDSKEGVYSHFENPTISDMFVLRGLVSYSTLRGFKKDYSLLSSKLRYIIKTSLAGNLVNDQLDFENQSLKNYFTDRVGIEGVMLAIGASQILFDNTKDVNDLLLGFKSISDVVSVFSVRENGNFFISDYLTKDNKPLYVDGDIVNNPGHCIEIIGLALKFLRVNNKILKDNLDSDFSEIVDILINMGLSHYAIGKNDNFTINLQVLIKDKKVLNNNCPWWSSFETLRMLSEIYYVTKDELYLELLSSQFGCITDIYLKNLKKNIPLQNVNSEGIIVQSIPATPDIDMGYHTSIPSFDVLNVLNNV